MLLIRRSRGGRRRQGEGGLQVGNGRNTAMQREGRRRGQGRHNGDDGGSVGSGHWGRPKARGKAQAMDECMDFWRAGWRIWGGCRFGALASQHLAGWRWRRGRSDDHPAHTPRQPKQPQAGGARELELFFFVSPRRHWLGLACMAAGVGCAKRQWGAPEHLRKPMDPGSRKKRGPSREGVGAEKKKRTRQRRPSQRQRSDERAGYETERE